MCHPPSQPSLLSPWEYLNYPLVFCLLLWFYSSCMVCSSACFLWPMCVTNQVGRLSYLFHYGYFWLQTVFHGFLFSLLPWSVYLGVFRLVCCCYVICFPSAGVLEYQCIGFRLMMERFVVSNVWLVYLCLYITRMVFYDLFILTVLVFDGHWMCVTFFLALFLSILDILVIVKRPLLGYYLACYY